jgi:outer membrane protein OmpA-like peptidoglycan-associated protein
MSKGKIFLPVMALVLLFSYSSLYAQSYGIAGDWDDSDTVRIGYYLDSLPPHMRPDTNKLRKGKMDQYYDYISLQTHFPPKQRHWSTLSITGGLVNVSGDVKSRPGWNVGINYRWNLGYIISMRLDFRHGRSYGQNYEAKDLVGSLEENQLTRIHNEAYRRAGGQELEDLNALINFADYGIYLGFHNFRTEITDASLSLVFHLNNVKWHKEKTWFNAYLFAGIGGMIYNTRLDLLYDSDGDGIDDTPYNYTEFFQEGKIMGVVNEELAAAFADGIVQSGERDIVRAALKELYGGGALSRNFETPAEGHVNEEELFSRVFNPTLHVGAAIDFLVHPRIAIGLEVRANFTNDDLLDGDRWSTQGDLTRDYDTYAQTALTLGVNLGRKKTRANLPMWWANPNTHPNFVMHQQPDVARIVEEAVPNDTDADGVPDQLDEEPDTPEDAIVDSKGRTLDSDSDGCPDHEDPEPFSTPLLPIVDCKNVFDFAEKDCCDERAVIVPAVVPCQEIELPSVHFDDDKYYVKPEYYAHLHEIARKMQDCPDLKVVADGHTDTRDDIKYNEQLSWNRVNASIDYLVEKYGISRDRFIVKYSGEREPLTGDESEFEMYQNRRVEFRFAEEGEEGDSNPPAPHPGIKAGSDR